MAALKLLTAGLGTFLLGRQLRISVSGALLAALIYMLCAPNIVFLQYSLATVASVLPWLLFTTDRLIRAPSPACVAAVAAAVSLSVLAGHPGTTGLVLTAGAIYGVALLLLDPEIRRRPWRPAGAWVAAMVLGAAGAAVVLVPFLQALGPSVTRHAHGELFARTRQPLVAMLNVAMPDLFGNGKPDYFEPDSHYELTAVYFGVPALLLAACGFLRRRRDPAFIALALVAAIAVMAAYGLPPVQQITDALPPYNSIITSKNLFIVALVGALAAGAGFSSLTERKLPWRRIAIVVAGLVAVVLVGVVGASVTDRLPAPATVERHAYLRFAVVVIAGIVCLAAVGRIGRRAALALVLVVAGLDLAYLQNFNAILPKAEAYPPKSAALDYLDRQPGQFRISPISIGLVEPILPPNTPALYDLEDIQGYDFPLSYRWANFSQKVLLESGNAPEHAYVPPRPSGPSLTALRMMNVRYYLATPGRPSPDPAMRRVYHGGDAWIYRDPQALPRAYVVGGTRRLSDDQTLAELSHGLLDPRREVAIPADAPVSSAALSPLRPARVETIDSQHVRVHLPPGPAGWLVLANAYSPQWRAKVDGHATQVEPTNLVAMGVPVSASTRTVDFTYDRGGFYFGAAVSAAAFFIMVLLTRPWRLLARRG
jgi:hypothetical protein